MYPPTQPLRERSSVAIWLLALFTVVIIEGAFTVWRFSGVADGELIDTDTYMHLVRSTELLQGESFFNPVIERSNVPYGETQHWTRPFDLLLIAVAAVPMLFVGIDAALFVAALLIGPLVLAATLVAAYWAAGPIIGPGNRPLSMLVVASQPALLAYSAIGRADHHGLLVLLLTVAVGLLLRLMSKWTTSKAETWLGFVMAAGVWVSTEFLAVVGIALLSLSIGWLGDRNAFARVGQRVSVSFLAGLLIAVWIERGPKFGQIEYDRVSLVHVSVGIVALAIFSAMRFSEQIGSVLGRLGIVAAVATGLIVGLRALFPSILEGPWAPIDPTIRRIWLDRVAELQPLLPSDRAGIPLALVYLGAPALGLLVAILGTVRGWISRLLWIPVLVGTPIFIALALRYSRFAPHAEVFGAFPLIWGLDRGLARASQLAPWRRLVSRFGLISAACVGFLVLGAFIPAGAATSADEPGISSCDLKELAIYLNSLETREGELTTMLAHIDFGSELLYRTRLGVIATPIRQQDAILDTYTAMTSTDRPRARRIIEERQIDLILLCPPHDRVFFGDPPPPESLNSDLLMGNTPSWLKELTLPRSLSPFRLFEVGG